MGRSTPVVVAGYSDTTRLSVIVRSVASVVEICSSLRRSRLAIFASTLASSSCAIRLASMHEASGFSCSVRTAGRSKQANGPDDPHCNLAVRYHHRSSPADRHHSLNVFVRDLENVEALSLSDFGRCTKFRWKMLERSRRNIKVFVIFPNQRFCVLH